MKEAYCSFEVAKLLKEKGFDEECHHLYDGKDIEWANIIYGDDVLSNSEIPENDVIAAPTHQMAMAWLREEKYILIFIVPAKDELGNLQYMADVWTWNEDEGLYKYTWCTANYVYEEAVEAALKYSLENLIKEAEK